MLLIISLVAAAPATTRELASERGLPVVDVYPLNVHRGGPQTFDITQDKRGVLYFGNLHGVLTYDGAWWRLIKLPDEQAALSVEADAEGRVALGLVNDFGYLAADERGDPRYRTLLPLLAPPDREFGEVRDICATARGFFFVTDRSVVRWDGRSASIIHKYELNSGPRACLADDRQVFLYGRQGLVRLDLASLRITRTEVEHPVQMVQRDSVGNLVLSIHDQGLFRLADGRIESYATAASEWLKGHSVANGSLLPDGRLALVMRDQGILIVNDDGTVDQTITYEQGLPDTVMLDTFIDREGSLWIAAEGPIIRIDVASAVSIFDARIGLRGAANDVVRHRGQLYVATSHGLYALTGREAKRVTAVREDSWRLLSVDDELFVGSSKALYGIRPDGMPELIYAHDGELYEFFRSPSDPSRVWLALSKGLGSVKRTGAHWDFEGIVSGTPAYTASVVERFGIVWCGSTFDGVYRIENPRGKTPRVTRYGAGEMGVFSLDGRVILVDAVEGRMFQPSDAASADGTSAHRLVPDPFLGHIRGDFFVVAQDQHGDVWINSIPPRIIRRRPDGQFEREGRPVPAVTGTDIQQIRTESNGIVWFASDRGLFRYDRRSERTTGAQPPPVIGKITDTKGNTIVGGLAAPASNVRLEHDFGRIRIEFAPVSFARGVTFQYRLDPVDSDWNAWTDQAAIDYTTLTSGAYVFRLRAKGPSGEPSRETRWSFEVLPPWYRTTWSMALWLLLAVAVVTTAFRLRTRALRLHAEALRSQVRQQTAELQETVEKLEVANQELQEAQEKIARFNEFSGEALRDIRAWSNSTAADLAISIHAAQIMVSIVSGGELVPAAATEIRPPRIEDLEAMPHKSSFLTTNSGETVVAVPGLTGRLFGALTIVGKTSTWTEPERQLISTFAHQLGGALELQQARNDLAEARQRNAAARRQMIERGIAVLQTCPKCARCYDNQASHCTFDGSSLDSSRLLPYRVANRYRLDHVLGSGGMGEVFAAHDERLDRDVALKVIKAAHFNDSDVRSRFDREAKAVARIHHPNVLTIYDSGEVDEGSAFIVTELLDGCDLGYVLRRYGRGTPRQVLSLLRQGAAALTAAHSAGLVHRDIKPANFFLMNTSVGFEVKLLDFGIAKVLDFDSHVTQSGTLIGTPAYMAPEQVTRGHADIKSDLYSFAAVAYESLLGVRVGGNGGGFSALWDVMYSAPLAPSQIRPILTAAIDTAFFAALVKDPSERPSNVAAWVESIAPHLEQLGSDEPGWPVRLSKTEARPSLMAAPTVGVVDDD